MFEFIARVMTWVVVLCVSGLGLQVLYGGDRSYPVTSSSPEVRELIKRRNVRYLPERKFYGRLFWTYVVKPTEGKFFFRGKDKGKILVYKPHVVASMGFRPVYSFWYRNGAMMLWPLLFIASVLLSFTSLNVYDILKNAFVGALEENVEEG